MTNRKFNEGMPDYGTMYEKGRRTFALLFVRFMDTNGWSHPVMTELASKAMGGAHMDYGNAQVA